MTVLTPQFQPSTQRGRTQVPARPSRWRKIGTWFSADKLSCYNRDKLEYYAQKAAHERSEGGTDNADRWERHRLDRALRSVLDPLTRDDDRRHAMRHVADSLATPVERPHTGWIDALHLTVDAIEADPDLGLAASLQQALSHTKNAAFRDALVYPYDHELILGDYLDAGRARAKAALRTQRDPLRGALTGLVADTGAVDPDASGIVAEFIFGARTAPRTAPTPERPASVDCRLTRIAGPSRFASMMHHEVGAVAAFRNGADRVLNPDIVPDGSGGDELAVLGAFVANLVGRPVLAALCLPLGIGQLMHLGLSKARRAGTSPRKARPGPSTTA